METVKGVVVEEVRGDVAKVLAPLEVRGDSLGAETKGMGCFSLMNERCRG